MEVGLANDAYSTKADVIGWKEVIPAPMADIRNVVIKQPIGDYFSVSYLYSHDVLIMLSMRRLLLAHSLEFPLCND